MTELIACLSSGKGTWGHVSRLAQDPQWSKIILITNEFGKENYHADEKTELIIIDTNQGLKDLRDQIEKELKAKVQSSEIALNLVSGTGKEHIAILSAVLRLGVGIRLVALTKDGVEEI
jgi:hypothetical protein